jgi:sulfur-oxidizing protein SoxA
MTAAAVRPLLASVFGLIAASVVCARAEIPPDERRSSYFDMAADTKAMQDDDTSNPAMLSVLDGEALWQSKTGAAGRACYDCHGDATSSMKGVAARYPAFDPARNRPIDLEQRINLCREKHQQARPFEYESKDLLALTAFVALQSRGEPIAPPQDSRLAPFRDNGRTLFQSRQGQLNLACSHCHDDNRGKSLAGIAIPQAHPTGYPIYRLEWQSVGSLRRRLRNCMIGLRAEPYPYSAPEYVDMELFLMWRARGMKVESPAVRP